MGLKKAKTIKKKKDADNEYGSEEEDDDDDPYFSKSDASLDSDGNAKAPKIIMFCKHTRYNVVKEVGKNWLEYHLTRKKSSDWDIAWFDAPIDDIFVRNMQAYQRVNHFPGIYNLARKNMLGRHLMRMQKYLPKDYNFFPRTYCCPHDYKDFFEEIQKKKQKKSVLSTYIVKPNDEA